MQTHLNVCIAGLAALVRQEVFPTSMGPRRSGPERDRTDGTFLTKITIPTLNKETKRSSSPVVTVLHPSRGTAAFWQSEIRLIPAVGP